jgi:hypothetical protein
MLHIREDATADNRREHAAGTTIGLQEEGVHISENWLTNWKTGINLNKKTDNCTI